LLILVSSLKSHDTTQTNAVVNQYTFQ